jgi:hypothetical protein
MTPNPAANSGSAAGRGAGTTFTLAESIRNETPAEKPAPLVPNAPLPMPIPDSTKDAVMSPGMAGLKNNWLETLLLGPLGAWPMDTNCDVEPVDASSCSFALQPKPNSSLD